MSTSLAKEKGEKKAVFDQNKQKHFYLGHF